MLMLSKCKKVDSYENFNLSISPQFLKMVTFGEMQFKTNEYFRS